MHPAAGTNPPVDLHLPHVLHIASGDLWAGAEVQLYTLAKSLTDLNVRVTVALLNHGMLEDKLRSAGIAVHVFDETATSSFGIILGLKRLVRTESVELVHTHRKKENILGSIAAILAGGIPSLRTVHGDTEQWPAWRQLHKLVPIYLDRMTGRHLQHTIISVSEELAARLRKTYQADKITVIPNGIIIPVNQAATARPVTGAFRIGIAGRLVAVKRADLFIRTARRFSELHPEIRIEFCLYGDGPLRHELEQLSRELETESIVRFAGHKNEMSTAFADLDVLMLPSDHEGLPMILLEAMAHGIPVVAHTVGGIPDVLNQGDCGILVTDHSPNGYADAVFRLLTDTQLKKNIVSGAMQRVTAHYNAELNARRYLACYLSAYQQATP